MIEVRSACGGVKDSRFVALPGTTVSLNEDGERLLSKSSLHLGDVVLLNGLVVNNVGLVDGTASVVVASLSGGVSTRCVGVVSLVIGKPVLIVVHGTGGLTTIATIGAIGGTVGAVNELLLREGGKLSGSDEVSTFEGASGGEGPA